MSSFDFVCNKMEEIKIRTGCIYIIKNKINEKVYIGQSTYSAEERFKQHLKPSILKQRGSYKIYNAINKYGKENFYYETLEEGIELDRLNELEIYYIEKFDSYKNGYNSTNGGNAKIINKIQDIDKLIELNYNKLSYEEIGLIFGVEAVTVERTLHSLNIFRNNIITKEDILNYQHLYNKDIAKIFNVSSATITRAFKKYGIKRGKGCNNKLNKQNQKRCNDYGDSLSTVEDKLPSEVPHNSQS